MIVERSSLEILKHLKYVSKLNIDVSMDQNEEEVINSILFKKKKKLIVMQRRPQNFKYVLHLHNTVLKFLTKTFNDDPLYWQLFTRNVVVGKLKFWFNLIKPQERLSALFFLIRNNSDKQIAILVATEKQAEWLCKVLFSYNITSECLSSKINVNNSMIYRVKLLIIPYSQMKNFDTNKFHYIIDFSQYVKLHLSGHVALLKNDDTENKYVNPTLKFHKRRCFLRDQADAEKKINEDERISEMKMCKKDEINSEVMPLCASDVSLPNNQDSVEKCIDKGAESTDSFQLLLFDPKSDVVSNLFTVLKNQNDQNIGETLLKLSKNNQICLAIKQSGCVPLLVQIVQKNCDIQVRKKGLQAIYNITCHLDQELKKQETRIYMLLDNLQDYTEELIKQITEACQSKGKDNHPVQATAQLMKLTFNHTQRQSICQFGGIHIIANLVEKEHKAHGSTLSDRHCVLMRKYACMILTNLTFDNSSHKALLCSFREFMRALVVQLQNQSDELRQVTGSILRNLSWHADSGSKEILRQVGTVTGLMKAAMVNNKETTLKSILSALWNLSAHCSENKSEICAIEGALGFLVSLLTFKESSESLAIIENSSGILRNISSQIAVRDDYREILRLNNGLQTLLNQLKSPSLTVVGNVCGILWNISAKCSLDQDLLWQMGAADILNTLSNSENKAIAIASSAALKNLISSRPCKSLPTCIDLAMLQSFSDQKLLYGSGQISLGSYQKELLNKNEKSVNLKLAKMNKNICSEHYCNTLKCSDNKVCNMCCQNDASTSRAKVLGCCRNNDLMNIITKCKNDTSFIKTDDEYCNASFENEDIIEEPVDYSQKYSESNILNIKNYNNASNEQNELYVSETAFDFIKNSDKIEKHEKFGAYAETDLDQPTDYSLRYAEDDSDSDICLTLAKNENAVDFIQDTVKTYCTEGTPYETPFNFSTATSLTDLHMDHNSDKQNTNNRLPNNVSEELEITNKDKNEICVTDNNNQKLPVNNVRSELSSGLMSPEKPINYCEEGTPGYFSRVSSFGSLESIPANDIKLDDEKQSTVVEPVDTSEKDKTEIKCIGIATEVKSVKFGEVVNYAEETPLMFSRSSSLASLDSIEQHSIHDDRSSIISDFSRLTSGVVSPSELPDSPTQTLPQSPKLAKRSGFSSVSRELRIPVENNLQISPEAPQKSVFEDNVTKFKEESTPAQFSTTTSLSSLTIDDQIDTQCLAQKSLNTQQYNEDIHVTGEIGEISKSGNLENFAEFNDDFSPVSEDEDMLAACISIGMQKKRHSTNKQNCSKNEHTSSYSYSDYTKTVQGENQHSLTLSPTEIDRRINKTDSVHIHKPNTHSDSVRTYCTEDTPIGLSRACSNSDLSVLSIAENDLNNKKDYLSDSSSNFSGEDDKMLAECIKSAMPKSRKSVHTNTSPKSTTVNLLKLDASIDEKQKKYSCSSTQMLINKEDPSSNKSLLFCDKLKKVQPLNFIQQDIPKKNILGKSVSESRSTTIFSGSCESPQVYCTEDTPIGLSRAGSHSDLSILSAQEETTKSKDILSDVPFAISQNDDSILAACIKSGMPKPRKNKAALKENVNISLQDVSNTQKSLMKCDRNYTKGSAKVGQLNELKISRPNDNNISRNQNGHSDADMVKYESRAYKKLRRPINTKSLKSFDNSVNFTTSSLMCDKIQKSSNNLLYKLQEQGNKKNLLKTHIPARYCGPDICKQRTNCDISQNYSAIDNLNKNYLSDDSNLSGDDENILVECIKSAMPKPRKTINKFANNVPIRNEMKPVSLKPCLQKDNNISNDIKVNKTSENGKPSIFSNLLVAGHKNYKKSVQHLTKPNVRCEGNSNLIRYSSKQKPSMNNMTYSFNKGNNSQKNTSAIPLPKMLSNSSKAPTSPAKINVNCDSIRTYCTEDTPAVLSHAGSHSDLSVLSIAENDADVAKKSYLTDESNNITDEDDDDKMLAACIKSAMPKPRPNSNLPIKNLQSSVFRKMTHENTSEVKTSKGDMLNHNLSTCLLIDVEKREKKGQFLKKRTAVNEMNSNCENNFPQIDKSSMQRKNGLATLSFSNESLNMSDSEEALLDQCIFSAMPKTNTVIRKKSELKKSS